ncbi:MAG: bifunctional riboflavin kinase/FAD synthetase [Pseudomonadota bacterium]
MKIHRVDGPLGAEARGVSAALGNFDGVHLGHRKLISVAEAIGGQRGAALGVVTFEPHPRRYFQPGAPPFRLTPLAEKARILADLGVSHLYCLRFGADLAALSPEAFVAETLVQRIGLSHVVVGEDFRFGNRRAGDAVALRTLGEGSGLGVTIQHTEMGEEGAYSSTAVRVLVEQGRCADAAAQLGRWHSVSGVVEKGDQRGRELGYPTANLALGEQLSPRFGVYACEVTVHDGAHRGRFAGVASAGVRPQFGENVPNFEVHLFDFAGDLYGAEISAALVAFLRPEARFASVDALVAQMDRDSEDARAALATAATSV